MRYAELCYNPYTSKLFMSKFVSHECEKGYNIWYTTGRITADTHKTPSLNDRSENNNGKWVAKTIKTARAPNVSQNQKSKLLKVELYRRA